MRSKATARRSPATAIAAALLALAVAIATPAMALAYSGQDGASMDPELASAATDGVFSFSGTADTVDDATENQGVEFLTIKTPEGNVFYLVIDRTSLKENVYLLSEVTESDLLALAGGKIAATTAAPAPETGSLTAESGGEAGDKAEAKDEEGGIPPAAAYAVIALLAAGAAAAYWFLKIRPERRESEVSPEEIDRFERLPEEDGPDAVGRHSREFLG